MLQAEALMKQAGYTASEWLEQAKEAVSDMNMSDEAKAHVIAAFIRAAAQDQHTMTLRSLAESGLLQGIKFD